MLRANGWGGDIFQDFGGEDIFIDFGGGCELQSAQPADETRHTSNAVLFQVGLIFEW